MSTYVALLWPCPHVSGFVCIRKHFVADSKVYASTRMRIRCVFERPHVSGFVAFSKVSTLETVFKSLRLPYAFFAGYVWTLSVTATKCLRIQTNPDTCGRGLCKPVNCIFWRMRIIRHHVALLSELTAGIRYTVVMISSCMILCMNLCWPPQFDLLKN